MGKDISLKHVVLITSLSVFLVAILIILQRSGITLNTIPAITYETGVTADGNPYKGSNEAPIKLVIYSDFVCAHCGDFAVVIKVLTKEYIESGKLQIIFHNFPNLTPKSRPAAKAAVCALEQGADKFWQYHDLLFEFRGVGMWDNSEDQLQSYAKQIDLNIVRFNNCLSSDKSAAKVQKDFINGLEEGVRETPTWFINGRKGIGAPSAVELQKILDTFLEK